MNLRLNITADIGGHTVHCGQVNLSVPDELVMQLVPPPPAQPGPSIWASVEQAELVVMQRDERPLIERSWMNSAAYARYGKRVLEVIAKMGRFQGTAAELVLRTGLEMDNRMVGQTLQAALNAEQLAGTMRREFQSKPYVYDVWVPGAEWGDAAPADDVSAPSEPLAEPAGSLCDGTGDLTDEAIDALVFGGTRIYPELDSTDVTVCRYLLGREPQGDELARVRAALLRLEDGALIKFTEILRDGAPALWEVLA